MGRTLVIAELGSSWCFGTGDQPFENVMRLIRAAKECGADVAKMQWTSDASKMAKRRGLDGNAANMYAQYLQWPKDWMQHFKAEADRVGIEWACTVYLIEDIATIAPLVKRFKVSAYESKWDEFVDAHFPYGKEVIISNGKIFNTQYPGYIKNPCVIKTLHCVSKYPTPIDEIGLSACWQDSEGPNRDGLSDHTANVLTGAAAVAAGARIVEAHIRLTDTDPKNPDYGHSLRVDHSWQEDCRTAGDCYHDHDSQFKQYVQNIRTVERML